MDPLQEPVVTNVLFTSRHRGQAVLFHRVAQASLYKWFSHHLSCLPACSFSDSIETISPESCFRFIYDDTLGLSNHSIVGSGPHALIFQYSHLGVVFQDVVTCDYYFAGLERIKDILHCCIESQSSPPMISQMLDYQWDESGRAGMHITHLLNWKHFSHWYGHHGDFNNVRKEDREYSAVGCNVYNDGFLWFSETQTSMHSTIFALTVIDFFFTSPEYKDTMFRDLRAAVKRPSFETLYIYVKYILEHYVPTSDSMEDVEVDAADLIRFTGLHDAIFVQGVANQTRGYNAPVNHPSSLFPIMPPKIYLAELDSMIESAKHGDEKRTLTDPYALPALQIAETIKTLLKGLFTPYIPDKEKYTGICTFDGSKRACDRLHANTGVEIPDAHYRHLFTSAGMIFKLGKGALSPILRMLLTCRIYAGGYKHQWSTGVGDMALGHAVAAQVAKNDTGEKSNRDRPFPYVPTEHTLNTECMYITADRPILGHKIPIQKHGSRELQVPLSMSRIEPGVIVAKAKDTLSSGAGGDGKIRLFYNARNYVRVPFKTIRETKWYPFYDNERDVIFTGGATHQSIADIAFTMAFYSTRLPFVNRNDVEISYETDEVVTVRLPEYAKGRIQRYMPMWLHYMQITPQNTIMSPVLFQNFYLSLQNNDIAGMLTVAESLLNMVSGRRDRVSIVPGKGRDHGVGKNTAHMDITEAFEYSPRICDNFIMHMGLLPLIIGAIDYDTAAMYPYKNPKYLASFGSLSAVKDKRRGNIRDQYIHPREYLFQFHPFVPTIYSAIRAFICTSAVHLLSLPILDTLNRRFRGDSANNIRFPGQKHFLNYANTLSQYEKNIVKMDSTSYVILPAYFPKPGEKDESREYIPSFAVPLIMHYYPLLFSMYDPTRKRTEILDFFLGVRLFSEVKSFVYRGNITEHVEGNDVPPKFAFWIGECYTDKQRDVFEHHKQHHDDGPSIMTPSGERQQHHNPVTPASEGFYDFLTLVELLSHAHAKCTVEARIIRDLSHNASSSNEYPHDSNSDDVIHSTYRGAIKGWNMLPQIESLIPFQEFLKFPPRHDVWEDTFTDSNRVTTFDQVVFSRDNGRTCAAEMRKGNDSKETIRYPDQDLAQTVDYDLFPNFSAVMADATHTHNEQGPLYGVHPFIPFALVIAPITHIPGCELKLK